MCCIKTNNYDCACLFSIFRPPVCVCWLLHVVCHLQALSLLLLCFTGSQSTMLGGGKIVVNKKGGQRIIMPKPASGTLNTSLLLACPKCWRQVLFSILLSALTAAVIFSSIPRNNPSVNYRATSQYASLTCTCTTIKCWYTCI